MSISFDNAISNTSGGRTTTRSETFTVGTGDNRIAVVEVQVENGFTVSSVTFGGVLMTLLGSNAQTIGTFNNTYLYYLVNPTSGANTVNINTSGSAFTYCMIASYSGVNQSTPFDGISFNNASGTSVTTNITTTIDNCWLIGMGQSQASTLTAGTGTTKRAAPIATYETWNIHVDSNGAKTPAGTYSLVVNRATSGNVGLMVAALQPFVESAAPFRNSNVFATL